MSARWIGKTQIRPAIAVVALLAIGYLFGIASGNRTVQADSRKKQPTQQHFQSGAQRSEALLRDISDKLGTMDARLERMETLAKQFVKSKTRTTVEETR